MKTALLMHGFPSPPPDDCALFSCLKEYDLVSPPMFPPSLRFTLENMEKYVLDKLAGRKPDVIFGISMGGILAPYIAKRFPRSRLVLIATAPTFKPAGRMSAGFWLVRHGFLFIPYQVCRLDEKDLKSVVVRTSPLFGTKVSKEYDSEVDRNLCHIKKFSYRKLDELVRFISTADSSSCLRSLPNRSLILAGKRDVLMPVPQASKLKYLLKNSEIRFYDSEHFDILTEESAKDVREWMGR